MPVTIPNMSLEEWKDKISIILKKHVEEKDIPETLERLEHYYYMGFYPHELIIEEKK